MMKCTREAFGGNLRELFQPLHNSHLSVADADAPGEYIEAVKKEGGIEVCKVRHRYEVFEG
jgi:hypothetical protein